MDEQEVKNQSEELASNFGHVLCRWLDQAFQSYPSNLEQLHNFLRNKMQYIIVPEDILEKLSPARAFENCQHLLVTVTSLEMKNLAHTELHLNLNGQMAIGPVSDDHFELKRKFFFDAAETDTIEARTVLVYLKYFRSIAVLLYF